MAIFTAAANEMTNNECCGFSGSVKNEQTPRYSVDGIWLTDLLVSGKFVKANSESKRIGLLGWWTSRSSLLGSGKGGPSWAQSSSCTGSNATSSKVTSGNPLRGNRSTRAAISA
jgi:hypothetical protein